MSVIPLSRETYEVQAPEDVELYFRVESETVGTDFLDLLEDGSAMKRVIFLWGKGGAEELGRASLGLVEVLDCRVLRCGVDEDEYVLTEVLIVCV